MIVYKAVNKTNGKIYIGQTIQDLKRRRNKHLSDAIRNAYNSAFHAAIRKYGKNNFKWETIEECDSKHDLDLAEEWCIRYYHTHITENGYNITWGGDGTHGVTCSDEKKQKISKSLRGKKHPMFGVFGKDNPNYGKTRSVETKRKISISKSGKNHPFYGKRGKESHMYGTTWSEERKKKMSKKMTGKNNPMYGTTGTKSPNYGKKCNKETKEKIRNALLGDKSPFFGICGDKCKISKEYIIIFPDGHEEKIKGLNKFCKENNLNTSHMTAIAKGKRRIHKGYRCRYGT